MPDIDPVAPSESATQSLTSPYVSTDRSSVNEGGALRGLADHPAMIHIRSKIPNLDRVKDHLIPMDTALLAEDSALLPQVYVSITFRCIYLHLHVFHNSGDRTYARSAYEYALAFTRMIGLHVLPRVAAVTKADEFHFSVIFSYLIDYPQDPSAALQLVSEFGTSAIRVILDLQNISGRSTLEGLHRYALTMQHPPLSYSKFLFHVVTAMTDGSLGDGRKAVFAAILQSFEITPMIVCDLRDFATCANMREYYCRCMVLHYIHYALFVGSNHPFDLRESFQYRLSADAIFPQPLEVGSRPFDLEFITLTQNCGIHPGARSLLLSRYVPNPWAPPEAHLDRTETNPDLIYQEMVIMESPGKLQPTIQLAKMTLVTWFEHGYNTEHLENAAQLFKEIASSQSTTKEERQAAQWWLTFIRAKPDPHAMDGYPQLLDLVVDGDPWTQPAAMCTIVQLFHADNERNILRVAELLPLSRATLALLDPGCLEFEILRGYEVRMKIAEMIDGPGPAGLRATDERVGSFFGDNFEISLVDLKARATSGEGTRFSRLRYARDWAQRSLEEGLPESIDAFKVYASLLQDNIGMMSGVEYKHRILSSENWVQHWSDIAVTAVVRYGGFDRLPLAVEFLEQSRSVTYRHLFQLRERNIQLAETHPDLEKTWFRLTSHVRNSINSDSFGAPDPLFQREHDSILQEIRDKPGFENFLRSQKYDALSEAAAKGPVIMVSSDPRTGLSHALIILLGREQPIHLQLPDEASYSEVSRYSNDLARLLAGDEQLIRRGWKLDTNPTDLNSLCFRRTLEWLWDHVVSPIFNTLEKVGYASGRVWWCPSGNFTSLPLHAAAMLDPYRSLISSYTPSLELLIDSRRRGPASDDTMMPRRLTAVGLPACPRRRELQPLYAVTEELRYFFEDGPKYHRIEMKRLEASNAQVGSVLDAMKSSHIVHLACHGVQDSSEPLNSHLILHDDELSLRALMHENLPFAEFAFLSACQTATGHKELANESVHLAGGFIAAGFKGVVGTLWSIADRDAPHVVRKVYESMVTQEGGFDVTKAAEGLHKAVEGMIRRGLPPRRWAPFIHVGI